MDVFITRITITNLTIVDIYVTKIYVLHYINAETLLFVHVYTAARVLVYTLTVYA